MASVQAISHDFGDAKTVCDSLLRDVGTQGGPKDTLGFLICDSLAEGEALAQELSGRVDYPVVGGTTLAFPLAGEGEEVSARFLVVQKPGAVFSVAVSDRLNPAHSAAQVQDMYRRCVDGLGAAPKLFLVLMPRMEGINSDQFMDDLFRLAGDVPVFGGMTGADLEVTRALVFANGRVMDRELVLVGVGGDVQPVVSVGARLTVMGEYAPTVTKSDGNVVYTVNDMPFSDYMRKVGLDPGGADGVSGMDALFQYGPLPVRLHGRLADDDGVPDIRAINRVNPADGSASFTASVPQGCRVSVGILDKGDITGSTQDCLDALAARMKENEERGYRYDAIFSVPCVARYFAQAGKQDVESLLLNEKLPKTLAVGTFYAFSEVCPTIGGDGRVQNRTHAESLVMCAF